MVPLMDPTEIPLEDQKQSMATINPKEWATTVKLLNCKLGECLKDAETHSFELSREVSAKIGLILDFAAKYFQATHRRTHMGFLDQVPQILKVDDWTLIIK